jgi:hypothetical protein
MEEIPSDRKQKHRYDSFDIFTAMIFQVVVFWVTPCSVVVGHRGEMKMEAVWTSETLVSYHSTNGLTTQKTTT